MASIKIGDVIRIPKGAINAFRLKSMTGIVVDRIPRTDSLPDDFEILVDGLVHAMGFQIRDDAEVISESR